MIASHTPLWHEPQLPLVWHFSNRLLLSVVQAEAAGDGTTAQPVVLKLKISKPTGDTPSMDLWLSLSKASCLTSAT